MDLKQNKLTKAEWESIEISVPDNEKQILKMIIDGYENPNIRFNQAQSLNSYIHLDVSNELDYYLYQKYFEQLMISVISKYASGTRMEDFSLSIKTGKLRKLRSGEQIKITNLEQNIEKNKAKIFEYTLIELYTYLLKYVNNRKQKYAFYLYTLIQLKKSSIFKINECVLELINYTIDYVNEFTKLGEIITNAYDFIEQNKYLLKYEDRTLFKHQKELFSICNRDVDENGEFIPKLILYTAPTGTGKTLSPIGLASTKKIIFVCVARHIGLALAKSAISVEKKVAFAFGCNTADDIRLHYFSAIDYTRDRRSGGIGKVDNSVGDNVEIMICDVQSYLTAMHYMMAFNEINNIITYWDEPTITLDYETHELHETIHNNWQHNQIPTFVLSCATLPSEEELLPIFADFREKFDNAEIRTITSFDCKKSIPILNAEGYCIVPHNLYPEYSNMINTVEYINKNKTLLRYFDLREIIKYIEYVNYNEIIDEDYIVDSYFDGKIENITMNSLKEYYLETLRHCDSTEWDEMFNYMKSQRRPRFVDNSHSAMLGNTRPPPGVSITTADAYTLTDGPTIFLTENVERIAQYYIKLTNIPDRVFQDIMMNIESNSVIINKLDKLEREIEHHAEKNSGNSSEGKKKGDSNGRKKGKDTSGKMTKDMLNIISQMDKLRKQVKLVSLEQIYQPNTCSHQTKWTPDKNVHEKAYVSSIGEEMSKEIMLLDIDNNIKFLLLLGIGVFTKSTNNRYMEIIKQLADEQRLYIIIASTDYIYGTNYQFCHGFIGKDLKTMTQQKTLQAMGRVGRNHVQQDYTIRFRDNEMIEQLFTTPEYNIEAINLCKLFTTD
tara:strand:- start:1186 stop:3696 length:2511 start_codon:yes stop_codon:yes gene_type:complete